MNSKKFFSSFVSVCLCAALLVGCGSTAAVETEAETTAAEAENENSAASTAIEPNVTELEVTSFSLPDASEEAEIFVEPIPDISDDFIRGVDVSSVLAEENSGVTYYNFDGEEQDIFMTLAQAGVNYIRLRVWNDPYDEDGNGYGGGNCDVETAVELGTRATMYGMRVLIDFHYSDLWADPNKQFAQKSWADSELDEKCDALYDFTIESLSQILDAGVDVGMVQIGNEINNGMSGETDNEAICELLKSGSSAVREISEAYGRDIQIAVHYTDITDADGIDWHASHLEEAGVDYDVFAMSYYPFWHGSLENMQEVAANIQEKYGKQVLIAETSYMYTTDDGDGYANSVDASDLVDGYAATVQSQATMIRDICAAADEADVIGVFYWEPAWIPVGDASSDNSAIWEKYGSGWASSYATAYDPDDAGKYYGGSSWDNQAMFDFDGYPLASLNVWKYLKYGATAPLAVDYVSDVYVSCNIGDELSLPEAVDVVYNDRSANTAAPVTWDEAELSAIDTSVDGSYEITGSLADGTAVTAYVTVELVNYVQNPSFEDEDTSMWSVTYEGNDNPTDFLNKAADAYSGDIAFHFWSESDMEFAIEQEFTDLESGTYQLFAYSQGGDMSDDSVLELYAVTNDGEQSVSFMLTSYCDWQVPTIPEITITDGSLTIGVRIKCNAKSWGTVDDITLNKIE